MSPVEAPTTDSTQPRQSLFRFSDEVESFAAGQVVFQEGHPGDVMYGVKEGEVEIRVAGKTLETVGPGGFVGEMALIDKQPRSAAAVAKTDCTLARINEQRFKFLVQQTPFFALEVLRVMARRLRQMDARID